MENDDRSAEDLYRTLLEEAKSARDRDDLAGALIAHARSAARGDSKSDRACALVSLGATLRYAGRLNEALDVLRDARSMTASVNVQVAAMTCEIAILCDQGKDEDARRVGESALELAEGPFLLNALGRAWMEGFRATGIVDFRERAEDYFEQAGSAAVA